MASNIVKSGYYPIQICVKCENRVSEWQKMYNHGVCPHCGYKGVNAVTIVSTKEIIVRKVKKYKFFNLILESVSYEGKTEKCREWIKKHKNQ